MCIRDRLKRADKILSSLERKDVKLPTISDSAEQQPETGKMCIRDRGMRRK